MGNILIIIGFIVLIIGLSPMLIKKKEKKVNINEWSYKRYANFYGKMELADKDFYTKIDKIYNYIEQVLNQAKEVKCILPFYYENFNRQLDGLVENKIDVEAIVSDNIFDIFEKESKIENLSSFSQNKNFLLIITDEVMVLGLFKDDGYFDQNRLLTSKNADAIKWAVNLFENFKNGNK